MTRIALSAFLLVLASGSGCRSHQDPPGATLVSAGKLTPAAFALPVTTAAPHLRTVFMIVMENANWQALHDSPRAPYIKSLVATAAHADQYRFPRGLHHSEPNYIWLEAGGTLAIANNNAPAANHRATTQHLVTLLSAAGIPWKAYEQGISGTDCPLRSRGAYAVKHDPFMYFDDITGRRSDDPGCIAHVRPLTELAGDLSAEATTPRYVFITPDLCHDMHDLCAPINDRVTQGDRWLAGTVEMIKKSPAYLAGGAIFITWDESSGADVPIGMIVVSPFAKPSYSNNVPYTHSSTLKTVQEIFGVTPLLGDAAAASTSDLSDLFTAFP